MNKEQRERLREAAEALCLKYTGSPEWCIGMDLLALLDALDAAEAKAWPISIDGPTPISDQRMWLARQLMDSKLTDAEAFGIVAHHPDIKDTRATAAEARVAVLEGLLREAGSVLRMMIAPDAIKSTTTLNAYTAAVAAEAKARAALNQGDA